MSQTCYTVPLRGLSRKMKIAQVSDLHNGRFDRLLALLDAASPDLVCVTGDFLDRKTRTERGFAFLSASATRYPTFVSLGNHEMKTGLFRGDLATRIEKTGATLLDNTSTSFQGLLIGGLSSGYAPGEKQGRWKTTPPPDPSFLDRFVAADAPKLLLCHHPEYYEPYLCRRAIPLILSGHAHGGQWRIFGRGIFAPGQGLFPRYTSGLYDGRLIVSRGLCQTHRYIPRLFNSRELVLLTLLPEGEK